MPEAVDAFTGVAFTAFFAAAFFIGFAPRASQLISRPLHELLSYLLFLTWPNASSEPQQSLLCPQHSELPLQVGHSS
jgi:hypothetical protein